VRSLGDERALGKPRMIRPNYPNINHHRIATRATCRCRLATRENSRESGPQCRLVVCQNQPAMRTLTATCSIYLRSIRCLMQMCALLGIIHVTNTAKVGGMRLRISNWIELNYNSRFGESVIIIHKNNWCLSLYELIEQI